MQFPTISSLAVLLCIATASAAPQGQGGAIYATQTYFSAGGCTGTGDGEATFGGTNLCQSIGSILDTVVSVKTGSVQAGCSAYYYTDAACTQGETLGVVGICQQASNPFKSTNVKCT